MNADVTIREAQQWFTYLSYRFVDAAAAQGLGGTPTTA